MLRYFVAAHFWLLFLMALLFGSEYARIKPYRYQVFGVGFIDTTQYNFLVLITLAATVHFTRAWWKTRNDVTPIKVRRHHELET
jgi:fumarate reductase subunit C